ncbi:MAG: septum site-determining protein MinC, partial [Comamonadaceae bacterium]|nr:septum site-determining protein MinC [Comamonadaceae bacterium]
MATTARTSLEFKTTHVTVVAVVLRSTDVAVLAADLAAKLGEHPDFFDDDPVLIDLAAVREASSPIDFPALLTV